MIMKHIASVSFGKDSLAMLLLLIEKKYPLDEVVFYDTGMEFNEIYRIRDYVIKHYLIPNNIKFTELHPSIPMMVKMINYPHWDRTKTRIKSGYGWCGGLCRWGTTEKVRTIDKYTKDSIVYVGIAYDEQKRLERLKETPNKISILESMKLTEKDCLEICYQHGFHFDELYKYLDRVSCWCCRNKNLKELRNIKEHYPSYWAELVALEKAIGTPMKQKGWLEDLFKEGE